VSALLGSTPVRTIVSIWSWLTLGILVLLALPIVAIVRLVTAPFDNGAYLAGYCFRRIAWAHQVLNPLWTFRVEGEVPTNPRLPYVVVANHESFVDMLAISQLPFEMKWVAKSEFFKIPIVGWLMRLARDIKLVRGAAGSGAHVYEQAAERLNTKVSVMLFPEGTRSASGELGEFKDGAFKMAISNGVPVLPLAVHGTRAALIKHDWRFGLCRATVKVLDPIPTEGLSDDDVADLRDRVRAAISDARHDLASRN
jgi:1-acyl-sn-glycerol-3-phosphate acyltransferase